MTHLLQVRIEDELWQQIQDAASADRRSVAAWVRLLIEDRLRQPQANISYTFPRDWAGTEQWLGPQSTEVTNESYSWQQEPASVSQLEENRKPGDAGSTPARRAGKGSRTETDSRSQSGAVGAAPDKSPSRKPKACKHTNQIRKLGRPFCSDCGEFV